jgi:hypothetical protein
MLKHDFFLSETVYARFMRKYTSILAGVFYIEILAGVIVQKKIFCPPFSFAPRNRSFILRFSLCRASPSGDGAVRAGQQRGEVMKATKVPLSLLSTKFWSWIRGADRANREHITPFLTVVAGSIVTWAALGRREPRGCAVRSRPRPTDSDASPRTSPEPSSSLAATGSKPASVPSLPWSASRVRANQTSGPDWRH